MTNRVQIPLPKTMRIPRADIYLVGYGFRAPNDLTLEALAVLERSVRILAVPPPAIDLGWRDVVDLTTHYRPDVPRSASYRQMADAVLDAAAEGGPVSFLTYGSPTIGVTPSYLIRNEAPGRGLRVALCQAPSFIELVCAATGIDPCRGLVIWESSAFVRLEVLPPDSAALILTQPEIIGVSGGGDHGRQTETGDMTPLRDQLLKTFPPTLMVQVVLSAALGHAEQIITVQLGDLPSCRPPQGSTLVITPLPHSWE